MVDEPNVCGDVPDDESGDEEELPAGPDSFDRGIAAERPVRNRICQTDMQLDEQTKRALRDESQ